MRSFTYPIFLLVMLFISVTGFTQITNMSCYPGEANAINIIANQRVFTNLTLPQTDSVKGYLEHLPVGYDAADVNTKYPVMIVLHVLNEYGEGTQEDMCKFFKLRFQQFPYIRIETGGWPTTIPVSETTSSRFITLTPQFTSGVYSREAVHGFIQYVKTAYNIDESKIYLIGTSQGANAALHYVSYSEEYASNIAGVLALSPCYNLKPNDLQNIKNGGVAIWGMQCSIDMACALPNQPLENDTIAAYTNYNNLKAAGVSDAKNVLSHLTPGNLCNDNPHDTWTFGLNSGFNYSTLSTPQNVYQWLGPLSSEQILPVVLNYFDAKLQQHTVELNWTTAQESNGAYFYIQRSGDDMKFETIDSVVTKNDPFGASYQYRDNRPALGNNFYRLVQADMDGKIQVFDIKKVSISSPQLVSIQQNPFDHQLKFSIQSSVVDQYQWTVRDLQGKTIHTEKKTLNAGKNSIVINSGNWTKGMYFLTIQSSAGVQSYKVIKQ